MIFILPKLLFPTKTESTSSGLDNVTTKLYLAAEKDSNTIVDTCSGCNTALHAIKNITEDCTAQDSIRQQHDMQSAHDLRKLGTGSSLP